ncbi:hypothetical protein CYLTODRAFT_419504 [Cylindrobasidium torrendii FP15055 ss-10]|uniref:Uncharacterized protein n=1 Tax=Cylindrobasidium torrendii FP15055 ss-10 TaxID=1314674 RepID=A0A0D7BJP5_9AGAR|nr:hypothetical protein CYLTODRAFT_419504 [Cylindrobasidium torrendii FP15055 ss-10]
MQTDSSRFAILDPSHYHTNAGAQPRVYTDRKGNMHDPDYHLFPVYASSSTHNSQSSSEDQEQPDGYYTRASSPPRSPRFGPTITVSPAPIYASAPSSYQCPTANKSSRRSSKSHSRSNEGRVSLDSNYSAEEDVEDDSSLYSEYLSEAEEAKDEQHPARCSEGVKKGIQSIALSVSIGAFRARRRVKSALRR